MSDPSDIFRAVGAQVAATIGRPEAKASQPSGWQSRWGLGGGQDGEESDYSDDEDGSDAADNDDDEDYVPDDSDAEEQEEEQDEDGGGEDDDEEDEDEAEAGEEDEGDLFHGQMDPLDFLRQMEDTGAERDGSHALELMAQAQQGEGGFNAGSDLQNSTQVPEVGAKRKRGRPKGSKNKKSLYGASVEEIYDCKPGSGGRIKKKKRRKNKKRKKNKNMLAPEVQTLLQQATVDYTLGRHKLAAKALQEVIRRAPNHPDAYRLMGALNEETDNKKRAIAFYMVEAHLSTSKIHGAEPWKRVTRLSMEMGLRRQAVYCLAGWLRRDKLNLDARMDKAVLLSDLGEPRKATNELKTILKHDPGNASVTKWLARLYFSLNEPQQAVKVMERHLREHMDKTDLTDVNILCELYMQTGRHHDALQLITNASKVLLGPTEELPIDLQVKKGICAFKNDDKTQATGDFQVLLHSEDADVSDLLKQVAELYANSGDHHSALQFYEVLLDHSRPSFDLLQQISECHRAVGDPGSAVLLYQEALGELDSTSDKPAVEVILALCELKIEMGEMEEAQSLVARAFSERQTDGGASANQGGAELLVWHAKLHLRLHDPNGFVRLLLPSIQATLEQGQAATALLDPRNMDWRLRNALSRRQRLRRKGQLGGDGGLFTPGFSVYDRRKKDYKEIESKYLPIIEQIEKLAEDPTKSNEDTTPTLDGLLDHNSNLLFQVVSLLMHSGDTDALDEARYVLEKALEKIGVDKNGHFTVVKDNLRLLKAEVVCRSMPHVRGWRDFRHVLRRWPSSVRVQNVYCQLLCRAAGAVRITKSIPALQSQFPASLGLTLLAGHRHIYQGHLAEAMNEYLHAYHRDPKQPLACLCLAVTMLKEAMSIRIANRHRHVIQAFTILCEYRKQRSNPQEAAYNMGRAAQDLGLMHLAIPFYEEALSYKQSPGETLFNNSDLCFEAAHNLVLVYKASGSSKLAQRVAREHLVV